MARSTRSNGKRIRRNRRNQRSLYQPLDPESKQIRILNVSPTLSNGRIVCWFEIVSLLDETTPVYEAISWCWGTPQHRREIIVDGFLTTTPEAAHDALLALCLHHGHYRVWIDAVCISQHDVEERNHQVPIMRDVYSSARTVLVWLGNGDETTMSAFESIDRLVTQCEEELGDDAYQEKSYEDDYGGTRYSDEPPVAFDGSAIFRLYSSPWFERYWAVQEILLAREAICYCGRYSCQWDTITLAATWLKVRRCWVYFDDLRNCKGLANAERLMFESPDAHLVDVFNRSIGYKASMPSDKVYGGLGLWCNRLGQPAAIQIDYQKPLESVYAEATFAAICDMPAEWKQFELSILIFSFALVAEDTQDGIAPFETSWVPRYDHVFDVRTGSPKYSPPGASSDGAADGIYHDWDKPETSVQYINLPRPILSVIGILVDKVVAVYSVMDRELFDNLSSFVLEFDRCRTAALRSTEEHIFAVTMTCGKAHDEGWAAQDARFSRDYSEFRTICEKVLHLQDSVADIGRVDEMSVEMIERRDGSYRYRHAMWNGSVNRRFFVTAHGRIGMGTPKVAENDRICILLGGRHPYVLREDGENWLLVGDAYVNGIMDGEFVRELKAQDKFESSLQRFNIH